MNFTVTTNAISGLKIITPKIFHDSRGYFYEAYKASIIKDFGLDDNLVQLNQSLSYQNVVRGLHFQTGKNAQAKLIRCSHGKIYDVTVDLRKNSPTFGKSFGITLSKENQAMLYIPIGFAHGFSTLSCEAEISYGIFGSEYNKDAEAGIRFDDPSLQIDWQVSSPIVSDKDKILPFFKDLKNLF